MVEEEKKAKNNLLFSYDIHSPGALVNNDLIYRWLLCYLHCFRCVLSACDWAELFSHVERGGGGPERLTSVWSKFMWNFLGPPGDLLFMNCNKKSHFDGMTLVHRQEGGEGCLLSLFARRWRSQWPQTEWEGERKQRRVRREKQRQIQISSQFAIIIFFSRFDVNYPEGQTHSIFEQSSATLSL